MGQISYQARLTLLNSDTDLYLQTLISSFSVKGGTSRGVDLDSTNDTKILSELGQARTQKNVTVFKTPSKDTVDSVLLGLSEKKTTFGLGVDIYVSYTGKFIHMIHFFGEDTAINSKPIREGGGHKPPLFKIEFSFKDGSLEKSDKENGNWIDSDNPWTRVYNQ